MKNVYSASTTVKKLAFCLLTALTLPMILTGCGSREEPVSRTDFCFDTVVSVTLYDIPRKDGERLLDRCTELLTHYDREVFSAHDERAVLWRFNHADPGEGSLTARLRSADVDPEFLALTERAFSWQARTDGAFSPTLGCLIDLWNIGGDPPGPVPTREAVAEALSHSSPEDPDARLDLGGIAKGYAADRLKEYLTGEGVTSAVINLGGNVLLIGARPDGSPFRVGIRDPGSGGESSVILTIPLSDQSVVTSGIYERYFEEDGVRYHHILDPSTGYPADSGLSSVTILSADSADGDALSTACLVLGAEKGQALIESLPDTEALFITAEGEQIRTAGFP